MILDLYEEVRNKRLTIREKRKTMAVQKTRAERNPSPANEIISLLDSESDPSSDEEKPVIVGLDSGLEEAKVSFVFLYFQKKSLLDSCVV
jgi:hypothetical protein